MMLALWIYQRVKHDASAVDVGWTTGLGGLAVFYALMGPGTPSRKILIGFLAGFWAFRLAGYLLLDRIVHGDEDRRYRRLRAHWGRAAQRNFFFFYQAQGLLAVVLSLPFLLICFNAAPQLHPMEITAVGLWLVAIIGETVADRQLAAFRANPDNRGRTCRSGLWAYSRHPNYFFEWLNWCAYALMALPAPYGWAGLASPVIMLFLILKVTGVPPSEEQALASRGDDYRDYQRTTSVFIPWFPKRSTT
jgi:steroid 5-alpha reductase family enzyme